MSDDRIARENLRRRFTQNQEDCTYTVLALLPTATENIVGALEVERLTGELQARRAVRGGGEGSVRSSEFAPTETQGSNTSSEPKTQTNDGEGNGEAEAGVSGSGFVHASQVQMTDSTTSGGEAQQAKTSKSKIQLWDEVKIYSITRMLTLLYTLNLLTLLTRIQLNLLGRRNYLSSVVSLAQSSSQRIDLENRDDADAVQSYGDDFDTNRMYLTFSWYLLHKGWIAIRQKVEGAVSDVFANVSPRDNVSYGQFASCIKEVRMRVEGTTEAERRESKWLAYLLPEREQEQAMLRESGIATGVDMAVEGSSEEPHYNITPSLRRLLDETSDIIDSPTFAHVLSETLDASFELLIEEKVAREAFKIAPQTQAIDQDLPGASFLHPSPRIEELDDSIDAPVLSPSEQARQTTCRLATVLALITRQAHTIGSGGNLSSLMASPAQSLMEVPGVPSVGNQALKEANEYLAIIEGVRDVEAFAAVIYSSNFEVEGLNRTAGDDDAEGGTSLSIRGFEKSLVEVGRDVEGSLENAWSRAASGAGAAPK